RPHRGADDEGVAAQPTTPVRVTEVEIRQLSFGEDTIRVPVGVTVRWVNRDPVAHTSTSDDGRWSSPLIGPGETYSRRFEEPGRYPYHCEPHPFMTGVVIVGEEPGGGS
ncbi:MAG: cupredoxin family copper-binding protein, partial [Halobacteriales archaeon]|nr:cupredoxin family copper-binding protein [Halobacteriales archaeon]